MYQKKEKTVKAITTREKAEEIFDEFHSSPIGGHSGVNKCCYAVGDRFYWPGMTDDIREWVSLNKDTQSFLVVVLVCHISENAWFQIEHDLLEISFRYSKDNLPIRITNLFDI